MNAQYFQVIINKDEPAKKNAGAQKDNSNINDNAESDESNNSPGSGVGYTFVYAQYCLLISSANKLLNTVPSSIQGQLRFLPFLTF